MYLMHVLKTATYFLWKLVIKFLSFNIYAKAYHAHDEPVHEKHDESKYEEDHEDNIVLTYKDLDEFDIDGINHATGFQTNRCLLWHLL